MRLLLPPQTVAIDGLSKGVSSAVPVLLQEILQLDPLVLLQLVPLVQVVLAVTFALQQ